MSEVEDTDLIDMTEIRNNHPEIESIRSSTAAFPEDEAHQERISDDFIMRHVTGEDLEQLVTQVLRVQEILNREMSRYGGVLRLNRTFEPDSFTSDLLNAYATTIARLLHRQAHIHHIISDLNVHMENPAPRRLYPQYTNYSRDEPPFADLSILFYHPRNSSPSHSPQMAARRRAANQAHQNGFFMPVPPGLVRPGGPGGTRMPVRIEMLNPMMGQQPGQSMLGKNSFVRLPGGGSIQNSNMHFNLAPNIGVRVNVQRAQIPVRPGMQMPRMPFMPMPGQGPPNAAFHIRIPRPGAPNPRSAPPNVNPQTGHLPNPSFMEFARSANLGGQRGQQNAGSGGQSDQNQTHQNASNNMMGMIGNILSSVFGNRQQNNPNASNSQSTQNLSTTDSSAAASGQERTGIPRTPSAPVIRDDRAPSEPGQGGTNATNAPPPMPPPAFMEHLAGIQRQGGRISSVGWQQHPVEANAIFLGPRPPSMVPIYTFDQYLCCYSRHYRAFTSNLVRRHDVPLIESTSSAESNPSTDQSQNSSATETNQNDQNQSTEPGPSTSSSQRPDETTHVAVNNNGELVFTENENFANFVRSALRSVLSNMADVNPSIGHGNPFVGGRVCAFNPIFATRAFGNAMGGPGNFAVDNNFNGMGQNAQFQRVVSMGMEEQSPPHDEENAAEIRGVIEGTIEIEAGELFHNDNADAEHNRTSPQESNDQQQQGNVDEQRQIVNMFGTVINNLARGNNSTLNQLFPEERTEITSGMGFVALVAAMMFRSLGLVDVMRLLQNDHTVISSSRNSILRNVIDSVLDGNSRPSSEDLDSIANRLSLSREIIERFIDNDLVHAVRNRIDIVDTLMNIDRLHIRNALGTVLNRSESDETFAQILFFQVTSFFDRIVSLAHLATDGRENGIETLFERVLNSFNEERSSNELNLLMVAGRQAIHNTIRERFPNGVTLIDELRPLLSRVQETAPLPERPTTSRAAQPSVPISGPTSNENLNVNEPDIRRLFPADWADIIVEDMRKQIAQHRNRHYSPATSFSDAYNLGISPHRRAVNIARNSTSEQLLSDALNTTLSTAMDTAGISNSVSILNDVEMTEPVENALRSEMDRLIEQRLKREADYEPEKFPNIKKRFNPNPDRDEEHESSA
uniref:Large proline-rich protein BAG6 n=1 Tax=Acrobeloides nanus TaxID=290746 RepID=A0A914E2J4_9BILA